MKLISLVIILLISTSTAFSYSGSKDAAPQKNDRLIVWIHGIGSSKSDTGFMKQTLEKHLPSMDRSQNYRVEFFDYETTNPKKTIVDFKENLNAFLTEVNSSLASGTKVSLVAHSQGGLITYLWLNEACAVKAKHPICRKIDSLTTLGSPLWGSRMASLAYTLKNNFGDILHLAEFGKAQLKDLALLSDATFERLELFTSSGSKNFRDLFRKQIRLKVISGYAPLDSRLVGPLFPGHGLVEDDMSVPLVSTDPQVIVMKNGVQRKNLMPIQYHTVRSMHMPSLKSIISKYLGSEQLARLIGIFDYSSLTDVHESCLSDDLRNCQTPVVIPLINHILNRPEEQQQRNFRSFSVIGKINITQDVMNGLEELDVVPQIQGPDELGIPLSAMALKSSFRVEVSIDPKVASIGNRSEIYSNLVEVKKDDLRFHFSGYFTGESTVHDVEVRVLHGRKLLKKYSVRVHGGTTSFVLDDLIDQN